MLYWALVFLLVAIVAGALGFAGVAVAFAAKIIFFLTVPRRCPEVLRCCVVAVSERVRDFVETVGSGPNRHCYGYTSVSRCH